MHDNFYFQKGSLEVEDNSLFSYNEVVISGDDRPKGMVNQMGNMSLVKAREGDSGSDLLFFLFKNSLKEETHLPQ